MNPALVSALAALAGSAIGALATFATTWLTQHHQARTQRLAQETTRREQLYGEFVDMGAERFLDALGHSFEPSKVVPLYALISRMRLFAPAEVVQSAEVVMDRIVAAYLAPNYKFELRGGVARDELDLLRAFTETCRKDLDH